MGRQEPDAVTFGAGPDLENAGQARRRIVSPEIVDVLRSRVDEWGLIREFRTPAAASKAASRARKYIPQDVFVQAEGSKLYGIASSHTQKET